MKRALIVLLLVAALLLLVAAPALAFIHVRVPGDDCGSGGPENPTAAAAITSQDRPGNMPPLGDDGGHDQAPDDSCPSDA